MRWLTGKSICQPWIAAAVAGERHALVEGPVAPRAAEHEPVLALRALLE